MKPIFPKCLLPWGWVFFCCASLAAQQPAQLKPGLDTDTQDQIEQLDDGSLEEDNLEVGDLERIAESRAYYLRQPIDLNEATAELLSDLYILSPAQSAAIIRRRESYGPYLDVLELQAIEELTLEEVRQLRPYVKVGQGAGATLSTLRARLQDAVGFAALRTGYQSTSVNRDAWLGPPLPLYLRVRSTAGRQFSVGLVVENDAGEPYGGKGNPLLFDYVSAHLYADELPGKLKTIALGDFGLNWGQGLINFSGFGTGKGAFVMNVQRNARWLIPHASVAEVGFYRGAAAAVQLGSIKAMALVSRVRPDGALDTVDIFNDDVFFGAIRLSGLHRTPGERAGRNTNTAWSYGGAVGLERSWGRISMHAIEHRFELPLRPNDQLYQRFDLAGDILRNASIAWQTFLGPISWFGEAAVDKDRDLAILTGLQTSLDRRTDLSVVYRRYDAGYRTLYQNAFGNTRSPENEEGLYTGIRMQLAPEWTLQGFVDFYRNPFARFRLSRPSINNDGLMRLSYEKRRRYSAYVQVRHRESSRDLSADESGSLRATPDYNRTSLRLQAEFQLLPGLSLRSRIEYARTLSGGEISDGTLVYQDLLIKPKNSPLSATARIALIDTDDFESRIYAFENDLLYRFRIPAYYGQGYRSYLNLRYRTTRRLTLELRGAFGRRAGSDDQVELATQARWTF